MNKNDFAVTPPMGWNSYDYYDTTVDEAAVKANADYMAEHLKDCGWEYIVVDIEWYALKAGSQRERYQYIPFWDVEMDEYSRLLPDPERFPSSVGGKGFKPLADYIHSKGLKFGIHIMRGIPRVAAHRHTAILGSVHTANEVADPSNICWWNPDMYGLRPRAEGAQEYYDSIMKLYAEWGVDFIKCDDICRMDMYSAKEEIAMMAKAINKSGRSIVFSLSPGPAKIEEAWHYEKYANMWRITDDFWDKWDLLRNMFDRCELWEKHVSKGCWPDCDMLPLGYIGKAFGHEHKTGLTEAEQITMLTLWSIFRSPMMLGCELTKLDDWTSSLITNKAAMRLLRFSENAHQIVKDKEKAIWMSRDTENGSVYLAAFNFKEEKTAIKADEALEKDIEQYFEELTGRSMSFDASAKVTELWTGEKADSARKAFEAELDVHGARLYRID